MPPDAIAMEEFRSVRRSVPLPLASALAWATLTYGIALTCLLPFWVARSVEEGQVARATGLVMFLFGSLTMVRWVVVQFLAFREHLARISRPPADLVRAPLVSILVPAHDEGTTIVSALESLMFLNYPNYEIIVVDDGSKDDTYEKAMRFAGVQPNCRVRVLKKANGGKWSALNLAYANSTGALILCVDADSRLDSEALQYLVQAVLKRNVVGVSGQVTIRNRSNLLCRMQSVEYLLGNGGIRTALSAVGMVTVVPGPIGLYRREALEAVAHAPWNKTGSAGEGRVYGPLSDATFAEDFELSLSVLALGGRIIYEPRANAYTKCPDDIPGLINQRYRWMRGTWQVFRIYMRRMQHTARASNPRLHLLMLLLYPFDIFLAPLLNMAFWVMLAITAGTGSALSPFLSWIGAMIVLNAMTTSFNILTHDDNFELLPSVIVLDLYQSLLVNGAWLIAGLDEVRGARMRWN